MNVFYEEGWRAEWRMETRRWCHWEEEMACIQILSPALVSVNGDIYLPWKQVNYVPIRVVKQTTWTALTDEWYTLQLHAEDLRVLKHLFKNGILN